MEKINITKFFKKVFDPKVFFKEIALKINELIDYIAGTLKPYKSYVAIIREDLGIVLYNAGSSLIYGCIEIRFYN